jgi:shikimate 5-dehydrogenase
VRRRDVDAVNTVVVHRGRAVVADNTDIAGLVNAWRSIDAVDVAGRVVCIFGAGGAARAALVAARRAGAARAVVVVRDRNRAGDIAALAAALGLPTDVSNIDTPITADIAVIAVPRSVDVSDAVRACGASVVHDLRYRHSPIVDGARDGSGMLAMQAHAAWLQFGGRNLAPAMQHAAMQTVATVAEKNPNAS